MIEKIVDINVSGKEKMPTFVVYPSDDNIYPVVILLMDAPGIRQELHDMASRIATCGYYVLCPNLYYRTAKPFEWNKPNLNFIEGYSPEASRELMFKNMDNLSNALVLEDIDHMIEFCENQNSAKNSSIGLVGYCMSGPFAFYAAGKLPEKVVAAASIHGVKLLTDSEDSPHLFTTSVKGELYFGCAETDSYAPLEMINALEHREDSHISQSLLTGDDSTLCLSPTRLVLAFGVLIVVIIISLLFSCLAIVSKSRPSSSAMTRAAAREYPGAPPFALIASTSPTWEER